MTGKTTSLRIHFPRINAKPQNPVSTDWLLLFPLGCKVSEAKLGRTDKSVKTASLIPALAKPTTSNTLLTMLLDWPEIMVQKATVKLTQLYYLWHIICLCDGLAVRPAASADENLAVTLRNSLLVVYQRGKRDFIHLIGGLHHMVHYRWTGMSRVS